MKTNKILRRESGWLSDYCIKRFGINNLQDYPEDEGRQFTYDLYESYGFKIYRFQMQIKRTINLIVVHFLGKKLFRKYYGNIM